jgi:hypothetical protein
MKNLPPEAGPVVGQKVGNARSLPTGMLSRASSLTKTDRTLGE